MQVQVKLVLNKKRKYLLKLTHLSNVIYLWKPDLNGSSIFFKECPSVMTLVVHLSERKLMH